MPTVLMQSVPRRRFAVRNLSCQEVSGSGKVRVMNSASNPQEIRGDCRTCVGYGQVHTQYGEVGGRVVEWRPCPDCSGTGFQDRRPRPPAPTPSKPPVEQSPPPPMIGPRVDEVLSEFGTYVKPPTPTWLTAEQLAPGAKLGPNVPVEESQLTSSPPSATPMVNESITHNKSRGVPPSPLDTPLSSASRISNSRGDIPAKGHQQSSDRGLWVALVAIGGIVLGVAYFAAG